MGGERLGDVPYHELDDSGVARCVALAAIAPTRRVAVVTASSTDPAPGPGGLLLGAVLARFAPDLDKDTRKEMLVLMREIERGDRIGQPRHSASPAGSHRAQPQPSPSARDPMGCSSRWRPTRGRGTVGLAAVCACAKIPDSQRSTVVDVLRKASMDGPGGPGLIDHLVGAEIAMRFGVVRSTSLPTPCSGRSTSSVSTVMASRRRAVKRYRALLRDAHPDHGADDDEAADQIAELSRAREILLS